MEDKKNKIEELKQKTLHKQRRKKVIAVGIGLLVLATAVFVVLQSDTGKAFNNTEKEIQADKQITIAYGVRPYRTSVNKTSIIEFKNARDSTVNITFETGAINEKLNLASNQSEYFNVSRYSNLPKVNYFNTQDGDTGQLIVK